MELGTSLFAPIWGYLLLLAPVYTHILTHI